MAPLSSEAAAALKVCEDLLGSLKIGGEEGKKLFESTIHPSGTMSHARYVRGGGVFFTNFSGELQEYIKTAWELDEHGQKVYDLEEAIWGEPTVLIDHDLATVWTPYWFRRGGKLSHVGTNSFGLLKLYYDDDGKENQKGEGKWAWKIVVAHDTARTPTEEEQRRLDEEYEKTKQ